MSAPKIESIEMVIVSHWRPPHCANYWKASRDFFQGAAYYAAMAGHYEISDLLDSAADQSRARYIYGGDPETTPGWEPPKLAVPA